MRYPEDGAADESMLVVERNKREIASAHSKDEIRKATMQIIRSLVMLTNTLKVGSRPLDRDTLQLMPHYVTLIILLCLLAAAR